MKQIHVAALIAGIVGRPYGTVLHYTKCLTNAGFLKRGPRGRNGGHDFSAEEIATVLFVSCAPFSPPEKFNQWQIGEINRITKAIRAGTFVHFNVLWREEFEFRVSIGEKPMLELQAAAGS